MEGSLSLFSASSLTSCFLSSSLLPLPLLLFLYLILISLMSIPLNFLISFTACVSKSCFQFSIITFFFLLYYYYYYYYFSKKQKQKQTCQLHFQTLIWSASYPNPTSTLHSSKCRQQKKGETATKSLIETITETAVLVSPFFFWGTSMVAMKEVLPLTGPFFVSSFRLIPAGLLLVAFAGFKGRPLPSGPTAWLTISLFALVDASCFQGFLAQGLQRTSAGLGSVIIDSQPLTVAILANLLFGESIGIVGTSGLVLGVIGLLLLELPTLAFDESNFSLWGSGEWWMLLAAQSMAVGTVMVRWVSKYSDPVMATGWHMVIGGLPLLAISVLNHDPAFSLSLKDLTASDILALLYTSIFGSAISYGVYFYNATKGSLTKLSSLTFLTPMFASIFGFLYLGETFSPLQLAGATVTVVAIYMVNYRNSNE
ncbi:INNER MEMBRANE TRANSPORTER [Salix viminalis]|uniref:INNER MEMBRANE TRANSPORTER n=1 Tax=Salix viminalis TaxID=40686 RepID=A0A9Q0SCK4_SALVM|nr:INNER MEMBRANE TRANSPORTER [Salix viminalis]